MQPMNKPRGNTPKTYRLSEQTISRIAGLQKQYDIQTATDLVSYAIDRLWEAPGDELRQTHEPPVVATTRTAVAVPGDGNVSTAPEPVQPASVKVSQVYPTKPQVWQNMGMKYDRITGEHREYEKLQMPPWTERWVEGGETDYWPA